MLPENRSDFQHASYGHDFIFHRKIERWVHLCQFIFQLPQTYCYAVVIDKRKGIDCTVYIQSGARSWIGTGNGQDRPSSISAALCAMRPVNKILNKISRIVSKFILNDWS